MPLPTVRPTLGALGAAVVLATAACSSDETTGPVGPGPGTVRSDTIDTRAPGSTTGATRWVYVSLANPGQPLAITDEAARTSTAWDVAFNGFATRTNVAAGVSAFCVCQNSSQAGIDYAALTAEGERPDFEAVGAAQVPPDAQFRADTLLAIGDWWRADAAGARTVQPNVYVIQRPNGAGFAKVQVVAVQSATGATPGRVTLRWATLDPARTAFASARTGAVDVPASGRVAVSLATGAATTGSDWDLAFEGWRILTNSGASAAATTPSWGAYNATALLRVPSFDATTERSVSPTENAYRADGYGVFGERPTWFYTSGAGGVRVALPTLDVYLVKRGTAVYKLQVLGYKKQVGSQILDGFVALRSARVSG